METDDETEHLRSAVLQTATSVLKVRQRADEEIRRSHEALEERSRELVRALAVMRATLDSTTDAILVTDDQGAVVDFNEKYVALWKTSREVLQRARAQDVRQIVSQHFAEPQRFIARIEEIAASAEESFDVLELEDGRMVERYSKVLTIESQRAGRVWSFRDATERNSAEIASRRLAAIVASSDDGIIGKDLHSIVTSWNAGAERIFGYSAEEMIGTSIMRLIPDDRQSEEVEILSRIRRGERLDHFETIRVAKDGRRLNVSVTVSPIKDSTGRVVGASKVVRDVTDRKQAEAALTKALAEADAANLERLHLLESEREARARAERTSRMKDEFLATLSHELRTPLNAVLGWVNILQLEKCQGAELEEGLTVIERNARAQAQIIEDLLDMSRIISGKVRLDAQPVELSKVLNESIDTVVATAEAKGVRIVAEVDPHAGSISGDPHRLQQVFWNLLNNAIKFTPRGGEIQVRLSRINSHVEVAVVDTGEGIAPDFLPYVFDRFQQADASTTRRHGGLGLGLAIVKQLVELHGGKVSVNSAGRGLGATFIVQLPLSGAQARPETESGPARVALRESPPLAAISLAGVHVLVVDDEVDAREFVKRLLSHAGATVTAAGSAREAMETIAAQRPDVLVCDIGMPEEDGYALIRRLRDPGSDPGLRNLPAVALTAYARSEDRTKAIRSGFQNHLAKPVEAAELLAIVSSLSDGRRGEKSKGD
ncbi:MAG: PAS domain S-box protein [Chthoniobacter sp.]|uniref:hybrid sensor histidine kinase/response regulator n=1 Tax=Chthoniobacter sp. TaxID=2510640 RepID=UPI0032A1E295